MEAAARTILCAWYGLPPRQVSVTSVRSSLPNISLDNLEVGQMTNYISWTFIPNPDPNPNVEVIAAHFSNECK